jgi:chemotaxis protein MotB
MPPRGAHGRSSGGHGSRRRRVAHAEGHEEGGSERWLVTYADMLTLLLVLFIVLFSISVVNTSKFISLKTSLASVFGNGSKGVVQGGTGLLDNDASGTGQQLVMPGNPVAAPSVSAQASASAPAQVPTVLPPVPNSAEGSLTGGYTASQVAAQAADFASIEAAITKALDGAGLSGSAQFQVTSRGLVITVVTNALVFPGNSADLESTGQRILAAVAPPLAKDPRQIEVDGYTNQENVSTAPYPSGWELSSARASAVVRYLAANGVSEDKLSAVGYSDQHPLYPVGDPRAITLNRRVEIVVLSNLAAPATNVSPAGSASTGTVPSPAAN